MKSWLGYAKALSDKNRMRIVALLLFHSELCACQIVEIVKLSPPTISRHMSILQKAHVVQNRRDGRWVYYRISKNLPAQLQSLLEASLLDTTEYHKDRTSLENILNSTEDLCQITNPRRKYDKS